MKELQNSQMVKAMQHCDADFDGKFYVGVISTGIYCLPSCKAKLPNIENVVFFDSREEAIAYGLRGCKRCKSHLFPDVLPEWLPSIIEYMQHHRDEKLNEASLMTYCSVNISTIRRHFKFYTGLTPLAFHRKLRLKHARALLSDGGDLFTAAIESGYESSSGFYSAYMKEFGYGPSRVNE